MYCCKNIRFDYKPINTLSKNFYVSLSLKLKIQLIKSNKIFDNGNEFKYRAIVIKYIKT